VKTGPLIHLWYLYVFFKAWKLYFALLHFDYDKKSYRMIQNDKCIFILHMIMFHQFVPPTYKLCREQKGCLLFQHLNVVTTCKCEPSPQIWPDCSGSSEINGFLTTINSFPLSFFQLWPLKTFKALVIFHLFC